MKHILLGLLVLTITACSSLKTDTHYGKETDFSKYKTFSWIDMKGKLTSYHLAGVNHERAQKAITEALTKKGLKEVEMNKGDLVINYLIKGDRDLDSKSFNISFGYHPYAGRNMTYNSLVFTSTREYESGTLFIDFVDREDNQLVWRGIANKTFPERSRGYDKLNAYYKIVDKLTKDFPPKKK